MLDQIDRNKDFKLWSLTAVELIFNHSVFLSVDMFSMAVLAKTEDFSLWLF